MNKIKTFLRSRKGEVTITYVLLAAGLITILAFVIIPGLRIFTEDLISNFGNWYDGIESQIFGAS